MGIRFQSGLSVQFSQSTERERSVASVQFSWGVSLEVAIGSNSPDGQHEGCLNFLWVAQLEMTCLVLLRCSR